MNLDLLDPELGGTGIFPVASTSHAISDDDADDRGESELSWDEDEYERDADGYEQYDDQNRSQSGTSSLLHKRKRGGQAFGTTPVEGQSTSTALSAPPGGRWKGKGKQVERFDGDHRLMASEEDAWADEGGDFFQEPQEGEELDRLIRAIRDSDMTVGGRTALDREFDRTIEEELNEMDDPLNNGIKSRKNGARARQRRRGLQPEPSPEVKSLLGAANRHYALGERQDAIDVLQEVVRIDPTLRVPWFTLATIYEEVGETEKAVSFKIIATHLMPVKQAAQQWASLGAASTEIGQLHQAIYCYSQAVKGNPRDRDSLWSRAILLKMSASFNLAIKAFTAVLNESPHDPGVLREFTPLLVQVNMHSRAAALYLAALEHYRSICPHVDDETVDLIDGFDYVDLEFLADVLIRLGQYARASAIIRTGVRWLQGREKETMWDTAVDDDREYDVERKQRQGWQRNARHLEEADLYELDPALRTRLGVARLGEGRVEEAIHHFGIVLQEPVEQFPELFGTIADCYMQHKMFDEALDVLQTMAENDEINGPVIWSKVAQCHHDLGNLDDAQECYEAVIDAEPDNLAAKLGLAKVLELQSDPQGALEMLSQVIAARKALGEISEGLVINEDGSIRRPHGRPRKGAEDLSGINLNSLHPAPISARPLTKLERAKVVSDRVSLEQARDQQFGVYLQTLRTLEADVDAGDPIAKGEWLATATHMVDIFRETRALFPNDTTKRFAGVLRRKWRRKGAEHDIESQAVEMSQRLQRTIDNDEDDHEMAIEVDSFRGIDFDKWLEIILKYAFLLTQNDEAEAGLETLAHVRHASPFRQKPQRLLTIQLGRAACFSYVRNYAEVVHIARWIQLRNQFQTEPLKMLFALVPSGTVAIEAFNSTTLQKFLNRQLRIIDAIARGAPTRVSQGTIVLVNEPTGNKADNDEVLEDDNGGHDDETGLGSSSEGPFLPTKSNPVHNLAYGQLLAISRSYGSAIIYLLRAYELAPKQPLVCLSLGVAYLHRAMSRQSDNRHHQIAQAFAFLSEYRQTRSSSYPAEVEYNFGRAFHHLGLQSYAIKHYEACLKLVAADRQVWRASRMSLDTAAHDDEDNDDEIHEPDDYGRVAAYNLVNLYTFSGSPDLARGIAHQWLAV